MKDEYIELIINFLLFQVLTCILYLIIDLFIDGIFFFAMPIFLTTFTMLHLVWFVVLAIKLNYKIIKRWK